MSAERFLRHGRFAHTYDVVAWAKRRRFQLVAVDPEALDYHPTYGRHPCKGLRASERAVCKSTTTELHESRSFLNDRKVVSGLKRPQEKGFVYNSSIYAVKEIDAVELLSPTNVLVKPKQRHDECTVGPRASLLR